MKISSFRPWDHNAAHCILTHPIVDEQVKMVYQRVGNMLDDVSALVAPNILARVALYRIRRSLGLIKAPVVSDGRAASA